MIVSAIWEHQGGPGLVLVNNENPYEISNGKHVMLLYGKDEDRAEAAAHWINHALEEEQLCIYASVYAFDTLNISSITNLSSKIKIIKNI